jgi:ABC-type amino acid transport substrate-binding protein
MRILFCLALFVSINSNAAQESVVWGTDEWEGFTNKNGTGFYHELMSQLFPSPQYQIQISYLPWKRSLMYLERKSIDMTGAMPASNKFYMSSSPILSETIYAVYLADNTSICCNFEDKLGSHRSGYDVDLFYRALPRKTKAVTVKDAQDGIKFVLNGKVDYFVDVGSVVASIIAQYPEGTLKQKEIGSFPLYWAFTKNQKGKYLKTQFDGRLEEMRQTGELLKLYDSHKLIMPH